MNVMFVERLLVTVDPWPNIREFILERDPMSVRNARKPLGSMHILLIIRESILGCHHLILSIPKSYRFVINISGIYTCFSIFNVTLVHFAWNTAVAFLSGFPVSILVSLNLFLTMHPKLYFLIHTLLPLIKTFLAYYS